MAVLTLFTKKNIVTMIMDWVFGYGSLSDLKMLVINIGSISI